MLKEEGRVHGRQARCRLRQGGQATVEFVLSLGVTLLLLLTALDFGRAFFGYIALVNATREGARSGVMTLNPATIEPAVRQEVQGNNLDPARLTVQYTWGGSGQPLVVTANYRFNLITTSILPFTQLNLRTSTTMAIP
jgi:Flp pilus assembly protein TadG